MSKPAKVASEGNVVYIIDSEGRRLGVHVTSEGEVNFTIPSGTPGTVRILSSLSPQEAKDFALKLFDLAERGHVNLAQNTGSLN